MVCDHGNMPGHDHIQGGGWSLVSGDVCCTLDGQGMGMDRGWKGGDSRTTTSCEPATIPHPTFDLSGGIDTIRLLVDVIHDQRRYSAGTPEYDGHVPL